MERDLASLLKATGYVSRQQLETFFHLAPASIPFEPWMLWYQEALWDGEHFHRGQHRRHWALRTEAFWHLAPLLASWELDPGGDGAIVRPDALFFLNGRAEAVALEADTGKETREQWWEKLRRYQSAPLDWRLLVVAQGRALRLQRLRTWMADSSPRPWLLVPESALDAELVWEWNLPKPELRPVLPQGERIRRYLLHGSDLPLEEAERALRTGTLIHGARERQHQADVHHLKER